jgi:NNP family nitrate/nitrite transporter-like MFS transporter
MWGQREQSNISFFFPKAQQGLGLGLNAGIGNLGVSLSQVSPAAS